jgi:hypothetical protein
MHPPQPQLALLAQLAQLAQLARQLAQQAQLAQLAQLAQPYLTRLTSGRLQQQKASSSSFNGVWKLSENLLDPRSSQPWQAPMQWRASICQHPHQLGVQLNARGMMNTHSIV